MSEMPKEVQEIINDLEKEVTPNSFGLGLIYAIQTIKAKYGIDDVEETYEQLQKIKRIK